MGQSVLRTIFAEINAALWFSIIADEAVDISNEEQMSVSIRWVDHDYSIHEALIGLVQLPDTKAATIFCLLINTLLRCSLPISKCRVQAFDGASNMSGIRMESKHWSQKKNQEHFMSTAWLTTSVFA